MNDRLSGPAPAAGPVPTLATERLDLRAHRADDFDAFAAMWGDADVTRHITGMPSTRADSWGRFLRHAGHWALLGYGYWALEERETGAFVGEVGFANFKRELVPSLTGMPEIGWVLPPRAHGRGFATEAARAAIAWADARLDSVSTVCLLAPENVPSIRVAEKCGYGEWARSTYHGEATLIYRRTATD